MAIGDGEGVVIIPAAIADSVADEAFEQTTFEDFVSEKITAGSSIFGIYPPNDATRAEFAAWRAANRR